MVVVYVCMCMCMMHAVINFCACPPQLPVVSAQKITENKTEFHSFLFKLSRVAHNNVSGRDAVVSALLHRITTPSFARENDTALDCVHHILCQWPPRGVDQLAHVAIPDTLVSSALESLMRAYIQTSEALAKNAINHDDDTFAVKCSETLLAVSVHHGSLADMAITSVLSRLQAKEGIKSRHAR